MNRQQKREAKSQARKRKLAARPARKPHEYQDYEIHSDFIVEPTPPVSPDHLPARPSPGTEHDTLNDPMLSRGKILWDTLQDQCKIHNVDIHEITPAYTYEEATQGWGCYDDVTNAVSTLERLLGLNKSSTSIAGAKLINIGQNNDDIYDAMIPPEEADA